MQTTQTQWLHREKFVTGFWGPVWKCLQQAQYKHCKHFIDTSIHTGCWLTWRLGAQSCRAKSAGSAHPNSAWICRGLWRCRGAGWGRSVPIHGVFIIKNFICQKTTLSCKSNEAMELSQGTRPCYDKHATFSSLLCQPSSQQCPHAGNPVSHGMPPAHWTQAFAIAATVL